jgi:hypothetical protein
MERDPEACRSDLEREGAHALLSLAVVIPGEDPAAAGQRFRDMTSATLRALAEPQPQQHAAMVELVERCRSRGWVLMLVKDTQGVVRRAIAVRPGDASGLAPSPAALASPNPPVTNGVFRHRITGQRYVIPLTQGQLEFRRRQMQGAPPNAVPSTEELDQVHAEAACRDLFRSMEGAGPSQQ